jgi:hypothetical protein
MPKSRKTGFSMFLKLGGKNYQLYPTQHYKTKADASRTAKGLRQQGYFAQTVKHYDTWLVYFRKK